MKTINGVQIRVGDLLYAIVKRWKMILFLALVGCGFGFAWSGLSYIQGNYSSYKISCSVAFTSQSATGTFTSNSAYLTNNDFHLAEDMVDAAIYVMKSDRVLSAAIGSVGLESVSVDEVADHLTIERYNETQIVEITLKWNNETSGIQIMNSLLESVRQVLPETLMIGSVAVIDEPTASHLAGGGGSLYMWPIMGALGFLFGVGIAVLDLIMRPTLLNLKDVENMLGLETLGIIPRDDVFFHKKVSLSEEETNSAARQNFASTAYILRNRFGSKEEQRSFYVTSTMNGEGKSVVAANLAVELANMEKHVLLLDLDTRNPCLGNMFLENIDYNRTLNALYKGDATTQEVIVSLTGFLDLLPTVLEYNAIPLDNTLFEFIKKLEADYDYVVIDAPPIGQTSDALSLNQVTHAALFVIRYDMVPLPDIEDALNKMDKSGVRILGCVVNAEQTIQGMTLGGTKPADVNTRKKRTVSAAMGDEGTVGIDLDDDLLTKSTPIGTAWTFNSSVGGDQDILDELTNDPASDYGRISDEDALDALYRMGIDGSWKNNASSQQSSPINDITQDVTPQSLAVNVSDARATFPLSDIIFDAKEIAGDPNSKDTPIENKKMFNRQKAQKPKKETRERKQKTNSAATESKHSAKNGVEHFSFSLSHRPKH